MIFEKFFEVLDNIFNGVITIKDGILEIFDFLGQIPDLIFGLFKALLESLHEGLVDFLDSAISTLYNNIVYTLEAIFVPDTGYIQTKFDEFLTILKNKFGFDTSVFESLFNGVTPVEDVYMDYSIMGLGNFRLKVLDASFLTQGVYYFRPFIRGFLVLLMFLFHVKQLISFFGYDAGVITGRSEAIAEAKKAQKE